MMQVALIGVSAGAATALLFASVASGSALSVPLFYLAPLPILIAALGWSHWAALIAAVVAAVGLAAVFGAFFFIAFMIGIGLPAWWLGYLALLARPATPPGGLEWYPAGHLVFWAAVIGAAIVIAAMMTLGSDLDGFRASLRNGLERMLNTQPPAPSSAPDATPRLPEPSRVVDVLIAVLPPAAAVLATVTNVVNLWLAERIVKVSGRLRRPPSDLSAMQFPVYAPALTGAAVAASFLSGVVGISAGVLAASLLMAYAILGFAVLHMITRGTGSRPFTLGGIYAAVIVFGWPVLAMSLLGLADTAFDFRGRAARRRGPPNPQT
ncbi:MAG: hypothetical protein QOF09_4551 [Alphaproteobacteria bacterium]|jgi:hypothetical protein|nr:hypothetical protein [Alphaproteobacteria bacterium]